MIDFFLISFLHGGISMNFDIAILTEYRILTRHEILKVSIIINVFNRVDFLKKALISLKYQSIVPDEIIISDDGSEEDIPSAIKDIIKDMNCRVKFATQEHKGFRLARSRNNGVRLASGDYLIFFDQDIVLTKNLIETFIKHNSKHQFCVAYPIRLTMKQTDFLKDSMIAPPNFKRILEKKQIHKIKKQYFKDNFYQILKRFRLRTVGPKLRGGVAAINREDYIQVNGYDENYQGWGNEDDDLGRRLYRAGIHGKNPFYHEFPLHLYHEPNHRQGKRVNQTYYSQRLKEIKNGGYRCEHGFENPSSSEKIVNIDLN